MPRKIIAGNWKMNLSFAQAMALADAVADALPKDGTAEVVLAPPFPYLRDVLGRTGHRDRMALAAQNCSSHESGAYTGEVSAGMLSSIGVDFVIIGHSERRQYFSETSALLAEKVKRCVAHGLIPIFCCGETLPERERGEEKSVVRQQLQDGLFHLAPDLLRDCIIAYEPVWAIGTGKTATVEQVAQMHTFMRECLQAMDSSCTDVPLLYGGSVNARNASELFSAPNVDGALVGGASLIAHDFISIIQSMR